MEPQLSNIRAIPTKKTITIVNHFVINTTAFMNKFAVLCEEKLNKIHQVGAALCLHLSKISRLAILLWCLLSPPLDCPWILMLLVRHSA